MSISFVSPSSLTPLGSLKQSELTRSRTGRGSLLQLRHRGNGNRIQFIHNKMKLEISALEEEIRVDREAQVEYQKQFARHERRKAELRQVIATQEEFTGNFDQQIGPFESRYKELQTSVDGLHRDAKCKYDAAVQLLVDKLNYHPSFKRHNDTI